MLNRSSSGRQLYRASGLRVTWTAASVTAANSAVAARPTAAAEASSISVAR